MMDYGEFPEYEAQEGKAAQSITEPPYEYVVTVWDHNEFSGEHRDLHEVSVFADGAEIDEHGNLIFYAEVFKIVPVMREGLFGVRKPGTMEILDRVTVACFAESNFESFTLLDVKSYGALDPEKIEEEIKAAQKALAREEG